MTMCCNDMKLCNISSKIMIEWRNIMKEYCIWKIDCKSMLMILARPLCFKLDNLFTNNYFCCNKVKHTH